MKLSLSIIITFLFLINSYHLKSQNHPLVTGVETFGIWDSIEAGEVPMGWDAFNRQITINGANIGSIICVSKDSADPKDSDYSVRIESKSIMGTTVVPGILTTADLEIDFMNQSGGASGGIEYSQKPSSLKGWYKFTSSEADTANISAWFSNDTTDIGGGELNIFENKSVWTMFTVDLLFMPGINPDTMNVLFTSSIAENNVPLGTVLEIDHIWFEGGSLAINKTQNIVDNFKIYPNPSTNFVNIESPELNLQFDVSIYNANGKRVQHSCKNTGLLNINISDLSSGIYFIEILHNDRRKMEKLIIR